MPPADPAGSAAASADWRLRQAALDTWQRSRVAGFLYLFGWVVVAWIADLPSRVPMLVALFGTAFVLIALLRWRTPPPDADSDDRAALNRWRWYYAIVLTLSPAVWALAQGWLLLDGTLPVDALMASMIATIGYATVIVNVYSPMRRTAALGAAVLFLPMLAVLWSDPGRHGVALAGTLYGTYLVGALLRSHAEYRRRLDLDWALREQRDRYAQLSRLDPLTGLANRRHFTERLDALARGDAPFALLILDIDHFKRVNDRHGHAVGDACLRAVAARMQAAFPENATLARLGGEEFGVLLDGDEANARVLAEAFRTALAAATLDCDGVPVTLTISGGVGIGGGEATADDLYRAVDRALYDAKRTGRDRVLCVSDATA